MREIGKQLFEDIRRQAESIINPKINDELDLKLKYKFDWQMNECLGTSRFDIFYRNETGLAGRFRAVMVQHRDR